MPSWRNSRPSRKKALLPAVEVEPQLEEKVDFDTFCKSDLRAVKVKSCERVKKSDKLLRFTLDDGSGTDRQILSGIAKFYEPEALVGKTLAAIINLPPRKMMGAGIVRDALVRRPQGKGRGKAEPSHAERRHPRRREALLRPPVQPKTVKLQRRGFTAFYQTLPHGNAQG